ncbi:MAG: TonB-dependent receptor [Cellvibrionaceae bacterium]|nr:TonB-dependent receptor [Cellvibrionaceae bacterium]
MLKNVKPLGLNGLYVALLMITYGALIVSGKAIAEEDQVQRLQAITVAGSKRAVGLDRYDGAVVIKAAEELAAANVTQVQDLEKVFPGLLIKTRGNRTFAGGTIRGISSPDFYSPAIQVYVDGVPQDSAFLAQELINIESVELLRGPQGTLYGASAQGGLINIVTGKGEDFVQGSATYAGQEEALSLSGSTVLSDNFYGDISLRGLNENGRIKHIPTNEDDADDAETRTGIARLHYFSDDSPLEVTFSVAQDQLESREEWYLSEAEFDVKETSQSIPSLERDISTYALSTQYEFNDNVLTGVVSLQDREIDRTFIGGTQEEDQQTKYVEFRLSSTHQNSMSTVLGVNYQDAEFTREDTGFAGFFGASSNKVSRESQALFGEATIPLTGVVDLTLGLRVGRQKSAITYGGRASSSLPFVIGAFSNDSGETLTSPKIALGWQLSEVNRFYTSYTRGYRPNGFSFAVGAAGDEQPFDAEKSDNVEIGWRYQSADNRLLLDAALYWIELDDTQLYVGPLGTQVIQNVGEVESRGLELNATYTEKNLRINAGATMGRSRFKDSVDPIASTDISGNHVPYAPDATVVVGATYTIADLGSGDLFLGLYANYSDAVFFNEGNTLSEASYVLADFSVGYRLDNIHLELFGKNITNKEYATYRFQQGANVLSQYGEARVLGLSVSVEF